MVIVTLTLFLNYLGTNIRGKDYSPIDCFFKGVHETLRLVATNILFSRLHDALAKKIGVNSLALLF